VKTDALTLATLSARSTLSTKRAVPMLSRDEQLAISPTPTITEAPLSATTGAGDAAGGGVRLTDGLHATMARNTSETACCDNHMIVP
jgi:hypothetical protein